MQLRRALWLILFVTAMAACGGPLSEPTALPSPASPTTRPSLQPSPSPKVVATLTTAVASPRPSPTVTTTPPPPSPQARRELFFLSDEGGQVDVWWVDPEGGSPQRLTDDPAEERWPAFSPNGDWLAFVSVEDATETVHLMNLSTGQRQLVAGSTSSDPLEHPAWLDDGRLLYAARLSSHEIGLFLVDSGEALPLEAEGLPEEAVILGWSSAGGRVVLTVGLPGQHSDLFTATVSSEGRLILDEALAVGFEPKLSPDGQRLAFRAPPYSDDPAGYLLEFSSDEVSSYDEPAALRRWDHDLTWSSDGSHYAFVRSSWAWTGPDGRPYYVGDIREPIAVGGEEGIYAGGLTEPTARQITDVGYDVGPALSPDGGLLAFTANRDDYDRSDIWLLDLSTGEAQALVRGGGSCWGPIWRP